MLNRGLPWAYSFPSMKKRTRGGYSASPALRDVSWETHLGLTSWESLGEPLELSHWGSNRDGEGVRAYSNRCSDLVDTRFLLTTVSKKRSQLAALPIFRAKLVAPGGQRAQLTVLSVRIPSQRAKCPWSTSYGPPSKGTNLQSHPTSEHNLQSCPIGKHATDAQ